MWATRGSLPTSPVCIMVSRVDPGVHPAGATVPDVPEAWPGHRPLLAAKPDPPCGQCSLGTKMTGGGAGGTRRDLEPLADKEGEHEGSHRGLRGHVQGCQVTALRQPQEAAHRGAPETALPLRSGT